MRLLVLWDIDHTLVDVGAVTGEVYAEAFMAATGQPLGRLAELTGQTDQAIISATLDLHGLPAAPETVAALASALAAGFSSRQDAMLARGRPLPGAAAALRSLATRPGVVQSVLTGNMRPIAELKLSTFGLSGYLDLDVGAYGMDAAARSALVGIARERAAAKYGTPFSVQATVLIGDTPNDVKAAIDNGVRIIAVATGITDAATLAAAGAGTVLASLEDSAALIQAVLTET